VPVPAEITPPRRDDFTSDAQYVEAIQRHGERTASFWASEAGKAIIRQRRQYVLRFEPDGSFRVDDVPPGTYELSVTPMEPSGPIKTPGGGTAYPAFGTTPIGSVKLEMVVPPGDEAAADAAVDLGTLRLQPAVP
jgi:hypothetical protein